MKTKEERSKIKELLVELIASRDEKRQDHLVLEVNKISPDPEWLNYIYHSNDYILSDGTVDIEALIDKIFSYKPIIL